MESILARKTVPLIENKSIIENPSLIKVVSIKKKYLDQIKEVDLTWDDKFLDLKMIILGRCDQWIIYTDESKQLKKMARVDFVQFYVEEATSERQALGRQELRAVQKDYTKTANEVVNKIPVLFAD